MKISNIFPAIVFTGSIGLVGSSYAEVYPASVSLGGQGVNGCTWSGNCTDEGWGIDLNDNAGYMWDVSGDEVKVNLYLKLASFSGTRKMSLVVNGQEISVISVSNTDAPRPSGAEYGPYVVTFQPGNNRIELQDTEGTWEFDVHHLRIENSNTVEDEKIDTVHIDQFIRLTAAVTDDDWDYSWKITHAEDYRRELSPYVTWADITECENGILSQRLRGYLTVPVTGNYQLSIASDDSSELFLGESESSKILRASVSNWTSPLEFTGVAGQESNQIFLESGQKYYFEVNHYQRGGPGHLAIGWRTPENDEYVPISIDNFSSFPVSAVEESIKGYVTREVFFDENISSLTDLKSHPSYINNESSIPVSGWRSGAVTAKFNRTGKYGLEVVARKGEQIKQKNISLFVEEPVDNGNANLSGSLLGWQTVSSGADLEQRPSCGPDGSGCLVIDGATGEFGGGRFKQVLQLEPQTAYMFKARVRAENIEFKDPNTQWNNSEEKWKDSTGKVVGPYIQNNISSHARVAVDIDNPDWHEIQLDFASRENGQAVLELELIDASGQVYFDDIRIEKMLSEVTKIETDTLVLNLFNDDIAAAGGIEVAKAHADKVSRFIKGMEELTGHARLQCNKESAWGPREWKVGPNGHNGNPIVHRPTSLETIENAWKTNDVIEGIYSHEFAHNFDTWDGSGSRWAFGNHISRSVEIYSNSTLGIKRLEGGVAYDEAGWRELEQSREESLSDHGCYTLRYYEEKLLEYKDIHGWGPLQKVFHNTNTPTAPSWDLSRKEQYMKWWNDMENTTGDNGWFSLHTQAEQDGFNDITSRMQGVGALEIPANVSVVERRMSLTKAEVKPGAQIGWQGLLGRNYVDGNKMMCHEGDGPVRGLYAHAPSKLRFDLSGKWSTFSGSAAVQAGSINGSVVAIVKGDGSELFRSSLLRASSDLASFSVDVTGIDELELEFTNGGNGGHSDWSIWVDPELTR